MNAPAPIRATAPRRLGQLLRERGLISEDQLRIALIEQRRSRHRLGRQLVELGFLSDAALRDALSESLGELSASPAALAADSGALALVPRELASRHRLFPLAWDAAGRKLTIALANPNDVLAIDAARAAAGRLSRCDVAIEVLVASESDILQAIDRCYGHELSIDGILEEFDTGRTDRSGPAAGGEPDGHPVIRLVDSLLQDAVRRGASDIHFEPEAGFVRIRYRIDGVLRQIRALHQQYWPPMAVRLKVMANMNIAEMRAAQDGRISLSMQGRPIDFRAAVQPTTQGENIVLRILDRRKGLVPLAQLGLSERQLATLRLMMARPEGIIVVTGPTGSGKTTTLYSILSAINTEALNIMTLEDPVEYPLPLARQTSVSDAVKLDFASGIRSILRQDPDVILVGEIRDGDTARMALRAAMTGHQVYSTLHANSALGAIPRLLDMGIQPRMLAGSIIGVVAQRLVRVLCPHCRQARAASPGEQRLLGIEATPAASLYRPGGCERCDFQGYRGRRALMELMRFDADMDDLIARGAGPGEIRAWADERGFNGLADDGIRRILDGTTSLEEVARVVDLTALSEVR